MSNTKKCIGKESFQRMNYLLQLSNRLATENQSAHIASIQYSNLVVNISKKAVQRLDPDVKRSLCKGCRVILIPGITCKVRIKRKKVIKHCLKCSRFKVFDTRNKSYILWNETDDSLVELLSYAQSKPTKELKITKKSIIKGEQSSQEAAKCEPLKNQDINSGGSAGSIKYLDSNVKKWAGIFLLTSFFCQIINVQIITKM